MLLLDSLDMTAVTQQRHNLLLRVILYGHYELHNVSLI